jgi:hypothetical protein
LFSLCEERREERRGALLFVCFVCGKVLLLSLVVYLGVGVFFFFSLFWSERNKKEEE